MSQTVGQKPSLVNKSQILSNVNKIQILVKSQQSQTFSNTINNGSIWILGVLGTITNILICLYTLRILVWDTLCLAVDFYLARIRGKFHGPSLLHIFLFLGVFMHTNNFGFCSVVYHMCTIVTRYQYESPYIPLTISV